MKRYLLSALIVTSFSASMHAHDVRTLLKLGGELTAALCSAVATPEVLAKCFYIPIPKNWQFTCHFKEHDNTKNIKPFQNRLPVAFMWSAASYYSIKKLLKRTKDLKSAKIKK